MKPDIFAVNHPVFGPLWVRVLVTGMCAVIAILDTLGGRALWAVLFWIISTYLAYQFFWVFDPANYEREDDVP